MHSIQGFYVCILFDSMAEFLLARHIQSIHSCVTDSFYAAYVYANVTQLVIVLTLHDDYHLGTIHSPPNCARSDSYKYVAGIIWHGKEAMVVDLEFCARGGMNPRLYFSLTRFRNDDLLHGVI